MTSLSCFLQRRTCGGRARRSPGTGLGVRVPAALLRLRAKPGHPPTRARYVHRSGICSSTAGGQLGRGSTVARSGISSSIGRTPSSTAKMTTANEYSLQRIHGCVLSPQHRSASRRARAAAAARPFADARGGWNGEQPLRTGRPAGPAFVPRRPSRQAGAESITEPSRASSTFRNIYK